MAGSQAQVPHLGLGPNLFDAGAHGRAPRAPWRVPQRRGAPWRVPQRRGAPWRVPQRRGAPWRVPQRRGAPWRVPQRRGAPRGGGSPGVARRVSETRSWYERARHRADSDGLLRDPRVGPARSLDLCVLHARPSRLPARPSRLPARPSRLPARPSRAAGAAARPQAYTTRPGLRIPSGSRALLMARITATASAPRWISSHSRRALPIPCSPVTVPPRSSAA
jgi:hypothetical protein